MEHFTASNRINFPGHGNASAHTQIFHTFRPTFRANLPRELYLYMMYTCCNLQEFYHHTIIYRHQLITACSKNAVKARCFSSSVSACDRSAIFTPEALALLPLTSPALPGSKADIAAAGGVGLGGKMGRKHPSARRLLASSLASMSRCSALSLCSPSMRTLSGALAASGASANRLHSMSSSF